MHSILQFLYILAIASNAVNALQCYTCTTTQEDPDQSCVTDPAAVQSASAITNCNKRYCTSMRVEYLDPRDVVASMYRSCEDKPTFMNTVIEDGTNRIYFRACQEDLCNGGTGKDTSGGGITGDVGEALVIIVPGTGSSSTIVTYLPMIVLSQILLLI